MALPANGSYLRGFEFGMALAESLRPVFIWQSTLEGRPCAGSPQSVESVSRERDIHFATAATDDLPGPSPAVV